MTLHLHRAGRADRLADALAALLSGPGDDPFAVDVVAVPTRGVERWLAQRLSRHLGASPGREDGICAQVSFRSLPALLDGDVPDDAPVRRWHPRRLLWPLLEVLEAGREQPWAEVLWAHLDDGRRVRLASHLADRFAAYGRTRPDMVADWLAGRDVDPAGRPLEADRTWQPELYRRLATRIGPPPPFTGPTDGDRGDLPDRVSVFGPTRLDARQCAQIGRLAADREVHLWLPHPSSALWETVAERCRAAVPGPTPPASGTPAPRRTDDPSAGAARHPLLAYFGRDSRELQVQLLGLRPASVQHHDPGGSAAPQRLTLLARLQAAAARNDPLPAPDVRPRLAPDDDSIRVHAAHGPDRQVEVLRDAVLGRLADDPTLEPRDVVVMCPDIETFAPLISAAFGLQADPSDPDPGRRPEHPAQRLRIRLADRSLRSLNPLLGVLSRLLDLVGSRFEASAVLDLCLAEPVTRKFGFGEDDAERITELVTRAGVRWGLDADHRATFGLAGFGQNTWAAGLQRILLGVAMDEDGQHHIGTALPLDEVDSADVDLVGRLAECLARVRTATDRLRGPQPVADWMTAAGDAIRTLCAAAPGEAWQAGHAAVQLRAVAAAAATSTTPVSLPEVRFLLAEAFRGRASRANFRTGTLTVCTLLPMRSVPHRVVCLLGLDDGVFPRRTTLDGDDVAALDPHLGDHDPRSEDRQLFLDALLAAEEHLVVVYSGADPRSGLAKPPAVPLGELLDVIDASVRAADGGRARDQVLIRHPLQPFDPRNFDGADPESFDPAALSGARAALTERASPVPVFDRRPLPPPPPTTSVDLEDLVRFYSHPARALLRARGGLVLFGEEDPPDEIPVDLDGLQSWTVGDRLLRLHLAGADLAQLAAAEWRRGALPPRALGHRALQPVLDQVREVAAAARPHLAAAPVTLDVRVGLAGTAVTGTVGGVRGRALVAVSYARLTARQRLPAWIRLLALTAGTERPDWEAVTVGRGRTATCGPVEVGWARDRLAELTAGYRSGLREPLPFTPRTSAEYARIRLEGKSVAALAPVIERQWERDRDAAWERFLGAGAPLSELAAAPARAEETSPGLEAPSRFGSLALRVWAPLLTSERLS